MIPHVQPKGTNIRFEKLSMYPQLKLVTNINPTCLHESASKISYKITSSYTKMPVRTAIFEKYLLLEMETI